MAEELSKKCTRCKLKKNYNDFSKDKHRPDGLNIACKDCKKISWDNYKLKNPHSKNYKGGRVYTIKILTEEDIFIRKEKDRESSKARYWNNKELCKKRHKEYYYKNYEKIYANNKEYREKNKEKLRESSNIYKKRVRVEKLKSDPCFKIKEASRDRMSKALKFKGLRKSKTTEQMLGISIIGFMKYIEGQFTFGMNWDNYGKYWHLDHIIPISVARNEEELLKLFNYTNIQPLWAFDNLSKGDKILNGQLKLTIR